MSKSFMELHTKIVANGRRLLVANGLCTEYLNDDHLDWNETFQLFFPTKEDEDSLREQGLSIAFWASEVSNSDENLNDRYEVYNSLRETIILFCAVIDGEI
jgi:hypothetical protein